MKKKKILYILVSLVIVCFALLVCIQLKSKKEDNKLDENISLNEDNSSNKDIPEWGEDAAKDEITNIFRTFYCNNWHLENNADHKKEYPDEIKRNRVSVKNIYNKLLTISDTNKFAKEFVKAYEEIDYENLDECTQIFIEAYLKVLFGESKEGFLNTSPGKILGAYSSINDNERAKNFNLYLKFENYKVEDQKYDHFLLTIVGEEEKLYEFKHPEAISVNDSKLNHEEFNDLIENSKIINLVIEYRDDVYKNLREKEILERKFIRNYCMVEVKEPEVEIKKEPQIGMTMDKVKYETYWGSPTYTSKTTTAYGTTEIWEYNRKSVQNPDPKANGETIMVNGYLYFQNGILTSITER